MNQTAYDTLHVIYEKHRRRHRGNPDSKQMCCMWSTSNPPDTIADTRPIGDIEKAFDIDIDEPDAVDLYDMDLDEAVGRILEMNRRQTPPADGVPPTAGGGSGKG